MVNAWDVFKSVPVFGAVGYGGEFLYNLATGKKDPVPEPPKDPVTEANTAVQNVAAESAAEAGQAIKEAGESVFNGITGTFDKIKKYAPVAVAGLAGLIILKAVKK
jgi:hypothetical protein